MYARSFVRLIGCGMFLAALPAFASSYFAFSGTFAHDDDRISYLFSLDTAMTVNFQSWSYAGGTDPLSNTVAAGGFAPVLSLFDGSGNLLAFNAGGPDVGGCGPRNSFGLLCLDAYFQEPTLNAGDYILVISEQDNTPNGPTLSDGFARDGQGDFTGVNFGPGSGSFFDAAGNQRTPNFEFTIGPVDTAGLAPEPSTVLLIGSGLLLAGLGSRRARTRSAR